LFGHWRRQVNNLSYLAAVEDRLLTGEGGFFSTMQIETDRLSIRYLRSEDLDDFYAFRSDPEVCRYQGYQPIERENARAWLADLETRQYGQPHQWVQIALELKSDGKVIGDIGLKPESDVRIVEFGISMSRDYQGRGLASEALNGVIGWLFREQGVHRVTGLVDVANARSIALMERIGFRREGHLIESFDDQGTWRDEYLYALLERDRRNG
jgi:RimJ/RimL family protein N-acetyltransferase